MLAMYVSLHTQRFLLLIVPCRLNARHSIGRGGASDSGVNTIPLALRGTNDRTLTGGAAAAQQSMRVGIHKETTLDLVSLWQGLATSLGVTN